MPNIIIQWSPNINGNTINQRTYYRQKNTGGSFLTNNFTPPNDLTTSATTSTFTAATLNTIYEFQVANICSVSGPTFNSNGIKEGIVFGCITPTETHTDTSAIVSVASIPSDITKIRFSLSNGGVEVGTFQDILVSAGNASRTFTGLSSSTTYTAKIQLITILNGIETVSNFTTCQVGITTNAPASCIAPTNLSAQCVNCAV